MGRYFLSFLKGYFLVFLCLNGSAGFSYPTPVDFDGSILRWDISMDDDPVTYEIKSTSDADISSYDTIIDESADLWSSSPNSYFRYARATEDQIARVTINLERSIDGSAVSSGYALFDEYKDQKPEHCSIFVLIDDNLSSLSIAKTILHELGHCLGLGHSLIPEAIMSYQLEKNSFSLDIDDQAAVSRLYPADGSTPKLPPGCSVGTDRHPFNLGFLALWLPLFVGFRFLREDP